MGARTIIALVTACAIAVALRLLIAWSAIELLVAKVLPDDAFYYFGVARHIIQGWGVTFDGRVPTNGFHPLWALLLLPMYALAGGHERPIHLALSLASLLHLGTGLLVFSTVRQVARDELAGLLSAIFFLLHPMALFESLNGLETSLSLLGMMGLFAFFRHQFYGPQGVDRPVSTYALLGGMAALMVLARTDTIFLFILIIANLLWRGRRPLLGRLAVSGATFLLLLSPWFIWSWLVVGTPLQTSGGAMPSVLHQLYRLALAAGTPPHQALASFLRGAILSTLTAFWLYAGLAITLMVIAVGVWRFLKPRLPATHLADIAALAQPFWLPIAAVCIMLAVHTLVRWYPRSWYFAPATLAFSLPLGPILAGVWRVARPVVRRAERWGAGFLLLIGAVFLAQGIKTWQAGMYPWQAGFLEGARWVRENTEGSQCVGAFNAGILAYFSGRETINLDGVMDRQASQALRAHQLAHYGRQRHIAYLVDYSQYVEDMYAPFYGEAWEAWLTPIAVMSERHPLYGAVTIYETH